MMNVYFVAPVCVESRSLVALGACTFTLVSQFGFVGKADQARVAASVASGVGFIGAGVSELVQKSKAACAWGESSVHPFCFKLALCLYFTARQRLFFF